MATVVISGVSPDPESFVNVADAIEYVTAMYGTTYTAWLALATISQGRTLVAATRYMDRLGLVDDAGVALTHSTTEQPVLDACAELAVLIGDDPDIVSTFDGSSNIASVNAGTAGVAFFNPTTTKGGTATKLPYIIQQLLGPYLPSASATAPIQGTNGNCSTDFDECDTYRKTGPY